MSDGIFSRVLLTGGGGFIGSNLLAELLRRYPSSRVTIIDNFLTGRRENLEPWQNDPQVELIEHDLTDGVWLDSWLKQAEPFSLILHLASPASPPRYQAEPVRTYLVNSYVTHQLCQFALRTGARLLFASTSEVYGDPLEHPQRESYWGNVNPNGPRSCYDEAKRLGETICGVHHRDLGADIRLMRIFNTYGPNMDPYDGRVIPSFCLNALQGQPIAIYGSGEQTRSFCYVDDLVAGILAYAGKDGLAGETINLGNPGEFTLKELLRELEAIVGHELESEYGPLPTDDPQRRQPDISKAERLLGWQPKVPLSAGLRYTYDYFAHLIQ
jgi:nucleoside-diphosphate-sugar epimerase